MMISSWRRSIRWIVVSLFLVPFVGSVATAAANSATFAAEGMRLTAHFAHEAVTIVISDGREFVLPQVLAASGAKYAAGDIVFWNKGDEAHFELDGRVYGLRVVDPSSDPWERARQAGAVFRAIGQEPGWLLEIKDNGRLHLLLDYGETEITTPIGSLTIDYVQRTRTYRTLSPTSPFQLMVIIREQVCHDAMSGEGFSMAVAINVGDHGRTYAGCGRDL